MRKKASQSHGSLCVLLSLKLQLSRSRNCLYFQRAIQTGAFKSSHFSPSHFSSSTLAGSFSKDPQFNAAKIKSLRIPSTGPRRPSRVIFIPGVCGHDLLFKGEAERPSEAGSLSPPLTKVFFGVKFSCRLQAWQLRDGGKHRHHALETDDDDDDDVVQSSFCRLACTWCSGGQSELRREQTGKPRISASVPSLFSQPVASPLKGSF